MEKILGICLNEAQEKLFTIVVNLEEKPRGLERFPRGSPSEELHPRGQKISEKKSRGMSGLEDQNDSSRTKNLGFFFPRFFALEDVTPRLWGLEEFGPRNF